MGFDPFDTYQGRGKRTLQDLQKKFKGLSFQKRTPLTPLPCGVVGFLGYDYGLYQEDISRRLKEDVDLPDGFFCFYDCIVTIDHHARKMYVFSSGLPEKSGFLRKVRAQERLKAAVKKIARLREAFVGDSFGEQQRSFSGGWRQPVGVKANLDLKKDCQERRFFAARKNDFLRADLTKDEYCAIVRRAKKYIERGDIYQVNISQRFRLCLKERADEAWEIYRSLRKISPTSFGAYLNAGKFQIISASPERFLRLEKDSVQAVPMKGTRPRGKDFVQDQALRREIVSSVKDRAELLMITDLLRNDLGRVCAYGSVDVKQIRQIEAYTTVFQATSTIEGRLRKDRDCFDVLRACFPGGSITGCPKIRAMEIIEELEPYHRGVYTGSLGYISFAGDMDFNILIRTLVICQGWADFYVGGGIVADSTPEGEYEETMVKARAIRECLGV